jgi:hypothetical protein
MHQPIRPLQQVAESIPDSFRLGNAPLSSPQMIPQEIPFVQERILMPTIDQAVTDPAVTDPAVTDPAVTDPAVTDQAVTDQAVTDQVTRESIAAESPEAPETPAKPTVWMVIMRGFQSAFQTKPLVTLSSLWIVLLVLGWMATAEIISPGNDQPKPKTPIAEAQREQSSSLGLLGAIGFSCATISIILAQQLSQDRRR